MPGEYMTMAQAVGEAPVGSPVFVAGIDFDPHDLDEVEVVKLASERHRYDRMRALEEENASLREEIAQLRGYDEHGEEY